MDLEGFAKRGLRKNDPEIKSKLISLIREVKEIPEDKAAVLAEAVIV
jgi:hydrogenase expression/formation protein